MLAGDNENGLVVREPFGTSEALDEDHGYLESSMFRVLHFLVKTASSTN